MKKIAIICLIALALVLVVGGAAQAGPLVTITPQDSTPCTSDQARVKAVLDYYHSPLPWQTLAAFKASHPDFDICTFLGLMWAESSLGTTTKINNPGSIKGGPVGTVWRDLRIGVTKSGYNIYRTMYDGQRAAIRLWYDRGFNQASITGDTRRVKQWYGLSVPGLAGWWSNLTIFDARVTKQLNAWGYIPAW